MHIILKNLPLDHNEFALAAEAAPNNNNGWIEWDVPLGGEMDEPMVDPEFDEEEMDDDDGPSTATPVGHPLAIMAPGVATQPQVIDDLCTQMDNLEYRHGALTRRMEAVSDIEVANSTAIGEIHPRVTTVEEQVQTLQTALHGAELQNQQLRTRVAEMESREGTMMSYMLWMEERLTVLEKRLPGPSPGPQIMPPKAMSEARMREVIREQVAASMAEFMANMNRGAGGDEAGGGGAGGAGAGGDEAGGGGAGGAGAGGAGAGGAGAGGAGVGGAGPAAPEITGCTYITFMKCDLQPFKGTEGAVGLCQWFEKLESVFRISDCKERDKVKFATATLQGRALTWWNGRIASMGIDAANGTPWTEVRKWMTEEFCPRSVLQRLEQELYNLKLKGTDIDGYTNRFHELALLCPRMVEPEQLMGQIIQDKTDEASESEKRKGKGDRGGRGDNRRNYNLWQNQRRSNAGAMTNAAPNDNEVCPKCKNKKHAGDCWKCGGNNRGAVYKLGAVDAQQDPKVVTGRIRNRIRVPALVVRKYINMYPRQIEMHREENIGRPKDSPARRQHVGAPVDYFGPADTPSVRITRFWSSSKSLGMNLDMSTAYHPKTDGQSERTIQTLEDMLRACVMNLVVARDKALTFVLNFSYNNSYHTSIKRTFRSSIQKENVDRLYRLE
ncbi:putative reverse transcriptase domain-containing protein [Tanacetum coccineum]